MVRKVHPIAPAAVADAAAAYSAAREAAEAAEQTRKDAAAVLLAAMGAADLNSANTPVGVVGVRSGRRTVRITCPALKKELELMQERAVRTGRAVEQFGAPFVVLS